MAAHHNRAYVSDDAVTPDEQPRSQNIMGSLHQISYGNSMLSRAHEGLGPFRRSRVAYISVAILCFINLINYMDRFTIAGVLDDVQEYYSLSNTEAGLLQTSFVVSYMIMAPIFGYLGDRYNRKYIMIGGVTFWSITTLIGSFMPKNMFGVFIFLRALVGTGEASYSTIAPTIIADLFSKDRRSKMLAFFYFAIPVGSGLGYIVGSQIALKYGSWKWSLRFTPVLGILSIILSLLFLREPPRGEAEGGAHLYSSSVTNDLADLYKTRSYVWSTLAFTCVTFATGALAWWAPKYMQYAIQLQSNGSTNVSASLIFGAVTCVAGIVGVMSGSFLSQYLRRSHPRADPLICASGVLCSIPLLFAGLVIAHKNIALSWILIFLGEVFLCVNWTIVADMLLYVVIPTRRSIAEAVQILVSHALGDASSPYILGMVSDALLGDKTSLFDRYMSLQYSMYIATAVLVLGGLCFFLTAHHIEQDRMKCSLVTHGIVPPLQCFPGDFPDDVMLPQPVQLASADAVWPSDLKYLV